MCFGGELYSKLGQIRPSFFYVSPPSPIFTFKKNLITPPPYRRIEIDCQWDFISREENRPHYDTHEMNCITRGILGPNRRNRLGAMMYVRTLFLVLLAQASAWQLASPVSSRSVVRRSCSPVAMDGLVDAAHVDTAQQIFVLVAEKVDSGKAFDEISKSAGPVFDSAVKTAGPLLESAGKEAGKAIEAAIPELQKGFEASKPVLQQTANDLAPVAKQAADIVAPVLQQARSRLVQMQYRRRVVSCGAHMLQQSPVQRRQMLCRGMVRVPHQARWYICSTEWWLADSCGTHTTPYTTHHAPRTTHHAPRTTHQALYSAGQAALAAGTEIGKQAVAAGGPALDTLTAQV